MLGVHVLTFAGGLLVLAAVEIRAEPQEADRDQETAPLSPGPFKPGKPYMEASPGGLWIEYERPREWKDVFGNSKRARLMGVWGASIVLDSEEPWPAFPLAMFREEDREYVRSALRQCGKSGLFPGVSDPDDEAASLVLSRSEWQRRLRGWSEMVVAAKASLREANAARQHLRNVRDRNAFEPLMDLAAGKRDDPVRTAAVEAIAGLGGPEASRFLVKLAMTDRSNAVRASALWGLCYLKDPLPALAEIDAYLRAPRSRDSALANLCGSGLVRPQKPDDPPSPIAESLIDVLIVKQPVFVPYYSWWESYTWSLGGHGYHGHFERGIKTFHVPVLGEVAHKLLVENSGTDYGYDRQAWREWYQETKRVRKSPPDHPEKGRAAEQGSPQP